MIQIKRENEFIIHASIASNKDATLNESELKTVPIFNSKGLVWMQVGDTFIGLQPSVIILIAHLYNTNVKIKNAQGGDFQ